MGIDNNKFPAWVEVDLNNLDYNFSVLKKLADKGRKKIMAVVKADAYGHGAFEVSKRALANGAYGLGVARAQEGKSLRQNGIGCPIYILGETGPDEADTVLTYSLIPSLSSLEGALMFDRIAQTAGTRLNCHINIDTGMHRLGIDHIKAAEFFTCIKKLNHLKAEGIFTHFACASDKKSLLTKKQAARFSKAAQEAKDILGPIDLIHSENSAACISSISQELDMLRLGIAMYGLNPFDGGCPLKLRPLLSLKARVRLIKNIGKGETVSYCGTFKAKKDSTIATFSIGYADGYSRLFSNRARIIISGEYAPVVGNVTMDMFMADISHIKGIDIGDEAILIGRAEDKVIMADELASVMGTINYEIVCMLRSRLPRVFKK